MESNGKEGNVVISERTKEIIENSFPDEYFFEQHDVVKIEALETKINSWIVYPNPLYS